LRRYLKTSKI